MVFAFWGYSSESTRPKWVWLLMYLNMSNYIWGFQINYFTNYVVLCLWTTENQLYGAANWIKALGKDYIGQIWLNKEALCKDTLQAHCAKIIPTGFSRSSSGVQLFRFLIIKRYEIYYFWTKVKFIETNRTSSKYPQISKKRTRQ